MSDRQSKNYEEAKKAFYSCVSERTRSKRDAYLGITAETHGTKERKRKRQIKPAFINSGSNSVDMDMNVTKIERVEESFINKNICSTSKIRGSTMQGLNKGFHAASSWKNVNIPSKQPFATVEMSVEDVSNRSFRVQEGNDNEDWDSEGCGIEIIDKAEFISQKSFSTSKMRSSSKEKMNESSSSASFKKDASKKATSDDYCESFSPKYACHGSYHAWSQKSSSLIQIESDSDDMIPEDTEIQIVDEAEIRNQKTHDFKSKRGQSETQSLSAARLSKNVGGACARKNVFSAHHSITFTSRDYCTGSDTWADDSITLPKKANNNEHRSFREVTNKGTGKGVLKKGKSPLTMQGYSTISSKKKRNADVVKEVPFYNYCALSSKDAGRGSHKEQADRSRSSAEKLNRDEDRDHERLGIEKIDESEFRKWRRKFVSEIGSSTGQKQDEEHIAATSAKNVRRVRKKISSSAKNDRNRKKRKATDSKLNKKGGAWNKNVDSSSNEFLSSSSKGGAWNKNVDSDDASTSLQDSEVSSYGAEQEMGVGIANRTRTKMGSITKASEVGNVSLGSDSSPTDSESDNSLDEDFKVENFDNDIELLDSHVEACQVQEDNEETDTAFHYDADAEVGLKETCSKHSNTQKGCDEVDGVNGLHRKDQSWAGTRRPKEVAPPSHSKDGYDHSDDDDDIQSLGSHVEACDVREENEKMDTTFHYDDGAKEGLKERNSLKEDTCSKQLNTQKGFDHSSDGTKERTEVTSSDSHVRAKTAYMANEKKVPTRAKEAAPSSHANNGYDHRDDGTKERTEAATTSDSHVHAKNKPAGMASEKKVPSRPKEAAPPSYSKDGYDHSDDGIKERTEAATSDSHVRAKNKPADMASEKKVPTGPKEAATPSYSKDVSDHSDDGIKERTEAATSDSHDHAQTDAADMAKEPEGPMRRKKVSPKQVKDLCSVLADAVLGSGQFPTDKEIYEEAKQESASQAQTTLPLKFRFEDEVPEQVEKTEYEKEIDGLFCELDCEWALEELQSFDYPEDNLENENSPPGETQHARCCRGKHELVLEDDEGLICIFCRHVELGPKDVMPEWAERTYRESERKRCPKTEQILEFDELRMHTSMNDDACSSSNATGTVWSIKPGVRESMYEHQREGFEFLWKNLAGSINLDELNSIDPIGVGGCIISHAPGTGKTRLTMVFVETYFKKFPNCRPVIISPASTLLTWEEEFKKWNVEFPFHNLSNLELSGKENKTALGLLARTKSRDKEGIRMIKICSWSIGGSILGISYSLFEKLTGERNVKEKTKKKREALATYDGKMRKILLEKPGLVVLDEGHTPRNSRSNIWNVLLKLQTEKRIILSGTPFQNNFGELFNTLRIVRPAIADVLAQERTFAEAVAPRRISLSRKHKVATEHAQSSLISQDALKYLKGCMSPFVHIHKGTILKQSLPGLRDCVILLKPPTLQKSVIETLEGSSNFKFEHEVAMISVHPYLLLKCETTETRKIGVDMAAVKASKLNPQEGVKTRFLLELVSLSMAVKEKVLVFSQYIQPLELIKEQLKEIFKWAEGKEILHMKGRQCQKQRQLLKNLFNDPQSESKIMLASTKCCSEGISLVGASRVVLLDVVWNPSVERQAICRAYRIGQKKFVHTYHLMTSGTTEDDKYCRQAEKERLSELVFSSSNESNQQKHTSSGIEDRILEAMIARDGLKGMFEKIINQPKETDLIQTFGLTD